MIRERGRGYQAVVYAGMDHRGRKRWLTGSAPTKREARQLEARLKVQAADGKVPSRAGSTLGSLLHRWLDANPTWTPKNEHGWSPTTRYGYERLVAKIDCDIGHIRLRALTAERLDNYYVQLVEEGLSANSVRNVHAVIRRSCHQGLKWGLLAANPALLASAPGTHSQTNGPDHRVVVNLLDAAETTDVEMHMAIWLVAATGSRRGELCGVRWCDLGLSLGNGEMSVVQNVVEPGGKITIKPPKSHATRRLALDDDTVKLLRAHRSRARERALSFGASLDENAFVFSENALGHTPIRPSRLSRRYRTICQKAGVSGVRLHDLRHYHASTLIAEGIDPVTVAARLGHRDSSVTLRIYSHAQRPADAAAASVVSRVLRSTRSAKSASSCPALA